MCSVWEDRQISVRGMATVGPVGKDGGSLTGPFGHRQEWFAFCSRRGKRQTVPPWVVS